MRPDPSCGFAAINTSKAAAIEAFEKHGASGRAAFAIGGGERHGVGLGDFGGFSFLKPFLELAKRIAGEVFFIQPGEGVIFAEVGQAHDGGGACARRWALSKIISREYRKNGVRRLRAFVFRSLS